MKTPIRLYLIWMEWDKKAQELEFHVVTWEGTETEKKFKVRLTAYNNNPREVEDGSGRNYQLWDKDCCDKLSINAGGGKVVIRNEESIEEWKELMLGAFEKHMRELVKEAQQNYDNVQGAIEKYLEKRHG